MKTKIILLAGLALAALTFVGCGHQSEDNAPASTNSAGDQPMPGASVSNNAITPPGAAWNNTNNPALTNWSGTNNSGATTNQ
ncbi:MAG: hypothetical protein PHY43_15115 [Verrucomicrobiales bacterium]|nr:hypothetical protein [Verrucomicrobiales bacterium]